MLNEDQAFSFLKRRILLDRGLDCEQYKENYLKRRIGVRLRATGAKDYLDYVRVLRTDPEEYSRLLDEMTINVTQFFRDEDVFQQLSASVIPELIDEKRVRGGRSLRVWCAGCASGEEPYSVAILIHRALNDEISRWNVRVLGSDLDEKSLATARRAVYAEASPSGVVDVPRYFEEVREDGKTRFRVRDEVKRLVKFERQNLLEEHTRRHFDIVLCRNVLIYFARDMQATMVRSLAASLRGHGYLVLGKSETLGPHVVGMFRPVFPRERIYRLVAGGGADTAMEGKDGA